MGYFYGPLLGIANRIHSALFFELNFFLDRR